MEFLQLKYFQLVARHEHITRASEELHIAQPTLSIAISRLEEELGVSLFDRVGRQIKLNQYGRAFLKTVDKIFLQLEDGKKELRDMMGNQDHIFSFAANNLYSYSNVIDQYNKLHPNSHFRQTVGPINKMRQALLQGEIDFCLSSPSIVGEGVECIPLAREELYLFVSEKHKFSGRKSIMLSEAANEPFISLPTEFGLRDLTESLCQQAGFKPNVVFESLIATGIIDLVNINMGVALLPIPPWIEVPDNFAVPIRITAPLCLRTISLSYLKNRYMPAATKNFIEYLIDYFKKAEKGSASIF